MPKTITPNQNNIRSTNSGSVRRIGLQKYLEINGRLPPIELLIRTLGGERLFELDRFLSYTFSSSVLIPVDTFSFNFVAPDDPLPFKKKVNEGDIAILSGAGIALSSGIIDTIAIETDEQFGEKVEVNGRDLMSYFEDQDAININDKPIWATKFTVRQTANELIKNTRIRGLVTQQAPQNAYLFATEPGESKLAALQRFLEPLNCIAWMRADGFLIIGRPNMAQQPRGTFIMSKAKRSSNVTNIKAVFGATKIANIVVPIWAGQEFVQERVPETQRLYNNAPGPRRLRKQGHVVSKSVVVSTPSGSDPQELSGVNQIQAGGGNLLQAYAKRKIARDNVNEIIVQVTVPGHYDERGRLYTTDAVWKIEYDRGDVNENMYCFEVEYSGGEEGSFTNLFFCRLGTIVSDILAP